MLSQAERQLFGRLFLRRRFRRLCRFLRLCHYLHLCHYRHLCWFFRLCYYHHLCCFRPLRTVRAHPPGLPPSDAAPPPEVRRSPLSAHFPGAVPRSRFFSWQADPFFPPRAVRLRCCRALFCFRCCEVLFCRTRRSPGQLRRHLPFPGQRGDRNRFQCERARPPCACICIPRRHRDRCRTCPPDIPFPSPTSYRDAHCNCGFPAQQQNSRPILLPAVLPCLAGNSFSLSSGSLY